MGTSKEHKHVPLDFEARHDASDMCLSIIFLFHVVFSFPRARAQAGRNSGGFIGSDPLFQTKSEFQWGNPRTKQMSRGNLCKCSVVRPKECGQCQTQPGTL